MKYYFLPISLILFIIYIITIQFIYVISIDVISFIIYIITCSLEDFTHFSQANLDAFTEKWKDRMPLANFKNSMLSKTYVVLRARSKETRSTVQART